MFDKMAENDQSVSLSAQVYHITQVSLFLHAKDRLVNCARWVNRMEKNKPKEQQSLNFRPYKYS